MIKRRNQDGGIEGHETHFFPQIHQKYIYMGSSFLRIAYWTLTKDIRHPEVQEISPYNPVGWKKKELGWDLRHWEGAGKGETFPHPGKPLNWWEDQLGQKGSFTGLEESTAASWWQAEQTETSTEDLCYLAAIPSPRWSPVGGVGVVCVCVCVCVCVRVRVLGGNNGMTGCWNLGFRGHTWGEYWGWLHGDSLKGLESSYRAATEGVCGRSPGCHRSKALLLRGGVHEGIEGRGLP